MRYNLESTLPINAFSPRGGRGPFSRGMTLEGGGGGGIVGGITNPISKALGTSGGGGGILGGLASLDKTVGNTIPGGWGTLATVAASMIPGGQFAAGGNLAFLGGKTAAMTGLGALTGSGALRPGGKFNLQGALMGGAAAYGMANLASGLEAAGTSPYDASSGLTSAVEQTPFQAAQSNIDPSFLEGMSANDVVNSATQTPFQAAQSNIDPIFLERMTPEQVMPSANGMQTPFQAAQSNIDPSALEGMSREDVLKAKVLPQTPDSKGFFSGVGQQAKEMGRGLSNLAGFGADGSAAAARAAFTGSGAGITNTALPILAGSTGLMALDEQEKNTDAANAAGAASAADYNSQMARVNTAKERARQAMQANPYQFAMGGVVNPPDDQTEMPSQTPMQRLENGGMLGYADGGSIPGYAEGRFLSGGGDGMSDDIPASIEGKQEARLADGEFVVPADVVSHLGNGSSKAGAKRLYSMMDKVRHARTGNKKQGKQINSNKFLAA